MRTNLHRSNTADVGTQPTRRTSYRVVRTESILKSQCGRIVYRRKAIVNRCL